MAKPVLGHDPFASIAQAAAAPQPTAKPQAAKAKATKAKIAPKAKQAKPGQKPAATPPAEPKAAPKKAAAKAKTAAPKKAAPQAPLVVDVPKEAAPLASPPPVAPTQPTAGPSALEIPSLRALCGKAVAMPAQGLSSLLGHLWSIAPCQEGRLPNRPAALLALENASPALPLLAITARALAEQSGRRVFILAPKPESLTMALAAKWMDPPCLNLEQARRALAQGDWVLAKGPTEAAALGRPLATLTLCGQKPICKSLPAPLLAGIESLALWPLWRPGKLHLHLDPAADASSKAGDGA